MRLLIHHPMRISRDQLLLVDPAMVLSIPAPEPPQPIPLALHLEMAIHLLRIVRFRIDEVVQHFRLVDESQHGGDGGRFAREERVTTARVDEGSGDDEEDEDAGRDAEGDPEGSGGFRQARVVCGGAGFDEFVAVDRKRGDAHGQDVRHDATETDEGDEVVFVEEGANGEVAVGGGGVVEGEDAAGSVAAGEDVKGFDGADVAFERAPDEFDHCCERGEEPGEFSCDDIGGGKHNHRDETQEDEHCEDEEDAGVKSEHNRMWVLYFSIFDQFRVVSDVLSLPQT